MSVQKSPTSAVVVNVETRLVAMSVSAQLVTPWMKPLTHVLVSLSILLIGPHPF